MLICNNAQAIMWNTFTIYYFLSPHGLLLWFSIGGSRISQKVEIPPVPKVGVPVYYLAKNFPENYTIMKEIGGDGCVLGSSNV